MAERKRTVALVLKLRAPARLSLSDIRREVRCLIDCQCNHRSDVDLGDLRVVSMGTRPTPTPDTTS